MDQIDLNKLWQNFTDTISKHYVDFDGRVGRAQYWWYIAVYAVLGLLVSIVGSITFSGGGLRALYGLVLFLPTLGLTARRLHDIGRTASWVLLLAVPWALTILMGIFTLISLFTFGFITLLAVFWPIIGLIWLGVACLLIYFCAQPGMPGPNEYGPPPPVWTPNGPPPAPAVPPPTTAA